MNFNNVRHHQNKKGTSLLGKIQQKCVLMDRELKKLAHS